LNSGNYTRDFQVKYLRRNDNDIIKITNNSENYNLYTIGGDVYIIKNNSEYLLSNAINQNIISIDDFCRQAIMDSKYNLCRSDGYSDGGSLEYYYPKISKDNEGYTILKLHTLDGNEDLYIGMQGEIMKFINQ